MTAKFVELMLANIPDGSKTYPMILDSSTSFVDKVYPERLLDYPIK